jgi:hypothetical protein
MEPRKCINLRRHPPGYARFTVTRKPKRGTSPAHTPKPSHPPATPRVYAPPYDRDERADPIGRMERGDTKASLIFNPGD